MTVTSDRWLEWQPLHPGFPGMGIIAYLRDGSHYTIRPSSIAKGWKDVRFFDAATQVAQYLGTQAPGNAVYFAQEKNHRQLDIRLRERLREEIANTGDC